MNHLKATLAGLAMVSLTASRILAQDVDIILHHGKVATVDEKFSIHEAIAISGERILRVGSNDEVLALKSARTELVNLGGRLVLPGLIDSHVHPADAAMTEFEHTIPEMESIRDVLDYIKSRALIVPAGKWIELRQIFITRLREQRYPTRAELDAAAPKHPVLFATGPDASVNSLGLQVSGIDKNFKPSDGGAGFAEKDPATGELTGILRNCTRFVKVELAGRRATDEDRLRRLEELFKDYNSVGFTSICDRDASVVDLELYRKLRVEKRLTIRVSASQSVASIGAIGDITAQIRRVAEDPLFKERDPWLRIIGTKTYLDGGMLTGSAYMREPWGVSKIYGISDPAYRGVLFIQKERLLAMVRTATEAGLQFTAHSVGDGAVHALLDAYEEVSRSTPVRQTRACITHSNFMSREAIEQAARLGVSVDIQPAWLYLDSRTLMAQFGDQRLRYFQPLRSLFAAGVVAGGGSDHMQKIGSFRAVNPYNPFLAMQTAITRRARWHDVPVHPEEALSREQAIRFFTINNAHLLFREHELGSLEAGKLADLVVLDQDLLTCPAEKIVETTCWHTYVNGRLVFRRDSR